MSRTSATLGNHFLTNVWFNLLPVFFLSTIYILYLLPGILSNYVESSVKNLIIHDLEKLLVLIVACAKMSCSSYSCLRCFNREIEGLTL